MHWTALASPLSFAWPAVQNFFPPAPRVTARPDVPYTAAGTPPDPLRCLDLFSPTEAQGAPVVLFLHGGGGGRRQGRKLLRGLLGLHSNVGIALAKQGVVAAIAGYRQGPGVPFEHGMDDALAALAWLRAHAAELGGDPGKIVLVGHSAGGHLALSLALHDPSPLRGVAPMCSVYDTTRLLHAMSSSAGRNLLAAFGPNPESHPYLRPERRLAELRVPLLVGVAANDPPPLHVEYQSLKETAAQIGPSLDAEFFEIPRVGHMGFVIAMGRPRDPVTPALMRFLQRVL